MIKTLPLFLIPSIFFIFFINVENLTSKIDENFRWASRKDFNEEHPTTLIGAIGNLIGLPAISIPNGFDQKGLPTSFQIMSNKHKDDLIIKLAEFIQDNTDWHNLHPN